jgi:hypothetical protein
MRVVGELVYRGWITIAGAGERGFLDSLRRHFPCGSGSQ